MRKLVTGYAHSTLKFKFHSNQNRLSHKPIAPRRKLDLFKRSLMYSGGNLWSNLQIRIKKLTDHRAFQKAFKQY